MNAHRTFANPSGRPDRRGIVSIAALVALLVVALIGAALLKVALARRVEAVMEERRGQAGRLADSGVGRALARLSASADYTGETWTIPSEEIANRGPATVSIRVESQAGPSARRTVRVQADYPAGSDLRSRQSREIIVSVPPTKG